MMDALDADAMTSMQAGGPLRSPPAPGTSPLSARHSSRRATSLFLPMWHRVPFTTTTLTDPDQLRSDGQAAGCAG